jgi:HK97 family phage major capsid protein|tara:strand:- start:4540 stop:5760 length:1221 start_codon:yes stop_codon:yes gene_type:complete
MSEEIKSVIDNLNSTFEDFKSENSKRLDEVEKKGSASVELESKVDAIADDITKFAETKQKIELQSKALEEAESKLNKLETMLARPQTGLDAKEVDVQMKAFGNMLRKGKDNIDPMELKALYESDDTLGGYYAPVEYVADLIKSVTEISPLRSVARIRTTSNRAIELPKRTGQFAASFVNETATRTETTGYLTGLMQIDAHELYAMVDISQALLEDSAFNLESEMSTEFGEQFAKAEGTKFISGTGVGTPQGITDSGAGVASVNSGSGTALTTNGLLDLMYSIKSDYMNNARFVMNRSTLASILKLEDGEGQKIFVNGMSYVGGAPSTILGKPYLLAEDMPNVGGSAKPIAYGDFSRAYTIVDRVALSIMRDPYTVATSGSIRYHARRRVGGAVVLAEAIKLQNISA